MNSMNTDLDLEDYKYELPNERIAKYPLDKRSKSKMLCFSEGKIEHRIFEEVVDILPKHTHLVFNDTKVIPARVHFYKSTGAKIEVFLLEPKNATVEEAMVATQKATWNCMIGNAKRWKIGATELIELNNTSISISRTGDTEVQFSWNSEAVFTEIIELMGKVPLPPYLNREVEDQDQSRYQTVYSKSEGAVAAPTAGLHFNDKILKTLREEGILQNYVTLHVSAGTFQPIKELNIQNHEMHREEIIVSKKILVDLIENPNVLAVGTTSMRTLESLYWYGVMLEEDPDSVFKIEKLFPYQAQPAISAKASFQNVLNLMERKGIDHLLGNTEIFIFPSYEFKVVKKLLTNFHMPGSTLILLVAAFVGEVWKELYEQALRNDYRFLSFGDCCLLDLGQ